MDLAASSLVIQLSSMDAFSDRGEKNTYSTPFLSAVFGFQPLIPLLIAPILHRSSIFFLNSLSPNGSSSRDES